jgi:hypothetical protein
MRGRRWGLPVVALAALQLLLPPAADAAAPTNDPGKIPCSVAVGLVANLQVIGLPLISQSVQIHGQTAKLALIGPSATDTGCDVTLFPLPSFVWSLARPAGSSAALTGAGTLTPSLPLDVAGGYTVTLTACPAGCTVGGVDVGPLSRSVAVQALSHITPRPALDPVLPPMTATEPRVIRDAAEKCMFGGGVVDPQWVTVENFDGPSSYELIEGWVIRSRVSPADASWNHHSNDHNMRVHVDPQYRHLIAAPGEWKETPHHLGVEWERNEFPERLFPTPGDRVSVWGYWILDCGHDFYAEIHPPVMTAVHRARPIPIPQTAQFPEFGGDCFDDVAVCAGPAGSNVRVPGIVTEVWFNNYAGEIMDCDWTSLHNPATLIGFHNGAPVFDPGDCIRAPSPLNRVFEFNIYLPKSPMAMAAELGKPEVPDVPLYRQVFRPFALPGQPAGPEPTITVEEEGGVTFLKVSIDLRGFTGSRYHRRILSGWVYPSETNWDLESWRLSLPKLVVHDDGDHRWNDGDWRFWVNTNNGTQEWTRLFNCDGCVHGTHTFSPPWRTGVSDPVFFRTTATTAGSTDSLRRMGPDVLLYPGQLMRIHTSGFEADIEFDDDTGVVDITRLPIPGDYSALSWCKGKISKGCASYTLHYRIEHGTPVGPAELSEGARSLMSAYAITPGNLPPGCLLCVRDFLPVWHPDEMVIEEPLRLRDLTLFNSPGRHEINAFHAMPVEDLLAFLEERLQTDPERVRHRLAELRQHYLDAFDEGDAAEELAILVDAIPPDLWEEFFADLSPASGIPPCHSAPRGEAKGRDAAKTPPGCEKSR